jgi:hypothetical protein
MADEITQKHLDRQRVRGAPSAIPGISGMVGSYDYTEITRQAARALSLKLDQDFTVAQLRDSQKKLSQLAAKQGLRVVEQPLFSLSGNPMTDAPHEWDWELLLPVRGRAKSDEDAGVSTARIHGGAYLESMTPRGFGDLASLYMFFLGHFFPSHKQQLTRPLIYHRVLDGIENDDPDQLTLAVYLPYNLSLKQPPRLLTREDL